MTKPHFLNDPNTAVNSPLLNKQLEACLRGDFDQAQAIANELKHKTPNCNRASFNRGWFELRNGNLHEGLCLLDQGRWVSCFGDPPLPTGKPIYRLGEELQNKFLLLNCEGGLGDEIINARFARNFAELGAKVTLACDPTLAGPLSRIKGVSSVVTHRSAPDVHCDFWVPAMSAARVLEKTYQTLEDGPYLSVNPHYKKKWNDEFTKMGFSEISPKIGLRFYGNPEFEHMQYRRFPNQSLISALGGHPWINLQLEETSLKIESWEDTLAIIDQLDLVITSCTSIAHASAALGKPTWVIVPILPYYIWALPGSQSPWYRSVRLFRQEKFGEWDDVFGKIQRALKVEQTGL